MHVSNTGCNEYRDVVCTMSATLTSIMAQVRFSMLGFSGKLAYNQFSYQFTVQLQTVASAPLSHQHSYFILFSWIPGYNHKSGGTGLSLYAVWY